MSCLLALCLSLGVTANSYDTLEPTYSYNLKAGGPVYAWASYEDQTTRILGQGLSDIGIISAGVGVARDFGKFSVFGEVGYAVLDSTDKDTIRDEIIYTTLVNNHGVRPIPSGDPERDPKAHTSYSLDNGWVGRLGVSYALTEALSTSLAYRVLSVSEHYELWDEDNRAAGKGWWQESHGRDLSAFEFGINYEF